VVVPQGADLPTHGHSTVTLSVPRPGVLGRPWAQTTRTRRLARQFGAEAILATHPATTLVRNPIPTAVVLYDFRHEIRPDQFSRARRMLRRVSYGRGYAVADGFISISRRTHDDLHRLHPRTRSKPATVAHLGGDHVLNWPTANGVGPAITFAHHTNKNSDLILSAWANALRRSLDVPDLLVLGTSAANRDQLNARIADLGIGSRVRLAPFLPETEFRQAMAEAAMIVFPSDFEGFGLPVVEGMLLGIPVVIGPEPACLEVAGGHAFVLADWTPEALAEAVHAASTVADDDRERARAHAAAFTWERCMEQTRAFLQTLGSTRQR
jgi:glycosyltransferase involved in cell wall biosynthesis